MDVGLLIVRVVVGSLLIGHGTQKLFGRFGGGGIEGTAQFFTSLRYPNGRLMAGLAGTSEAGGGLLLAMGFMTPFAAAAIIGVMLNAIVAAHWKNGLWVTKGGFEYPLMISLVALAVAWSGGGRYSVDGRLGMFQDHTAAGVVTLAIGCAGAMAILLTRRPEKVAEEAKPLERRRAA